MMKLIYLKQKHTGRLVFLFKYNIPIVQYLMIKQ